MPQTRAEEEEEESEREGLQDGSRRRGGGCSVVVGRVQRSRLRAGTIALLFRGEFLSVTCPQPSVGPPPFRSGARDSAHYVRSVQRAQLSLGNHTLQTTWTLYVATKYSKVQGRHLHRPSTRKTVHSIYLATPVPERARDDIRPSINCHETKG